MQRPFPVPAAGHEQAALTAAVGAPIITKSPAEPDFRGRFALSRSF
jgi:hypothetical protein